MNNRKAMSLKRRNILPALLLLFCLFIVGCNNKPSTLTVAKENQKRYPTISYLDIKLDESGRLPQNPYILEFRNGKKQVVFCGVNHLTDNADVENPMFAKIEQKFFVFAPDVAVNEGGDVSKKVYDSKPQAIAKDGEIGLLKILADSLKIKTVDGDMSAPLEFRELLKHYSKGEFLAYIVTERLMWSLKGDHVNDTNEIQRRYAQFLSGYIIKNGGVALAPNEQTFDFYTSNYEKLLGRKFDIGQLEPTNPFEPEGTFQAIGRKSKEIRDQYLLRTIDNLMDKHDKVFVVFGGWHLLTCEPGLRMLVARKR